MTATTYALPFNHKTLQDLRRLEVAPPPQREELRNLVRLANLTADLLEYNWTDLPAEVKEMIALWWEDVHTRKVTFFDRLRVWWFLLRVGADTESLREYLNAAARLDDVICDLLERDNPEFQEKFANIIDEAFSSGALTASNEPTPSSPEEWSVWLRRL